MLSLNKKLIKIYNTGFLRVNCSKCSDTIEMLGSKVHTRGVLLLSFRVGQGQVHVSQEERDSPCATQGPYVPPTWGLVPVTSMCT